MHKSQEWDCSKEHTKPCLFLIVKIAFKNESYKLFFQEESLIAQRTKLSIAFSYQVTNQVQIELIKAFYVDKNIIYEYFYFYFFNYDICFYCSHPLVAPIPCFELIWA